AAAAKQDRVPIVVGGTGLYFKALIDGLAPIPDTPDDIRRHWRTEVRRLGSAYLHGVLGKRDPQMAARLRPTDPQRIVRALEVLEATGKSLDYWQQLPARPILDADAALRLVLAPPRADLHRRCEARFDAMMAAGALDEVRALAARRLDPSLPILRALGVRPLCAHLDGRLDLAAAVAKAKAETRQYIKRQETWLHNHMRAWERLKPQRTECLLDDILSFLHR
ncbi:MAG: tRNA (adenosine(37)-N6)-dimethylallyltransferase, partial [Hyphomicrobiaceae bacterium]